METLESMRGEVKTELLTHIIPFWRALRDDTYGGYYGWLSYDLALENRTSHLFFKQPHHMVFLQCLHGISKGTFYGGRL